MSFCLETLLGIASIEAVLPAILIWSSLNFLSESNRGGRFWFSLPTADVD